MFLLCSFLVWIWEVSVDARRPDGPPHLNQPFLFCFFGGGSFVVRGQERPLAWVFFVPKPLSSNASSFAYLLLLLICFLFLFFSFLPFQYSILSLPLLLFSCFPVSFSQLLSFIVSCFLGLLFFNFILFKSLHQTSSFSNSWVLP